MFQFPANPTPGQQFTPVAGLVYSWNGTGWVLIGSSTAPLFPPGIMMPYAGAAPLPFQGWLLCDGYAYPTANYPALFAVVGYTYGGGGSTFCVPDLRGRVIAGVDNMGGSAAGRLFYSMSPNAQTLGATGGMENVNLVESELAPHAHGITDLAHSHGVNDPSHGHGVSDPQHSHGIMDPSHDHIYEESVNYGVNSYATQGAGPSLLYETYRRTDFSTTGITINASGTAISIQGAGTGISIAGSGTGLSATNAAGSGGGHLNMPPAIVLYYIIKS